ncbi:MAG: caspase family protein [Hyphomicrobium sp.]
MLIAGTAHADQKTRRAFVVGVSDYQDGSGLPSLVSPAQDADDVELALSRQGIGFEIRKLKNDAVKDKQTFDETFDAFAEEINPGDDVLFYFSGHGYYVTGKGNYFLLPSAKNQIAYLTFLKSTSKDEARELDTEDKQTKRFEQWISEVGISEQDLEAKIKARKPDVTIIIADACRSFSTATKGAVLAKGDGGLSLPAETATGVFRLYSAQKGQAANDGTKSSAGKSKKSSDEEGDTATKRKARAERKPNSLYTRALLRFISTPKLEINELHAKVKRYVRAAAVESGGIQIPDFSEGQNSTDFFFFQGDDGGDTLAACATASDELERLRFGVSAGSVSRDEIEAKRGELAPCGREYVEGIAKIARLQSQGAGELQAQSGGPGSSLDPRKTDPGDPTQLCDRLAASPFDKDRPQGIAGVDIRRLALDGLGSAADRQRPVDEIARAIDACTKAVADKGRVARFKFNLASAHYAMATLSIGLSRDEALRQASILNQEAVDLGYAAAYNSLALMHQNGEYFEAKPRPDAKKQAGQKPATADPISPAGSEQPETLQQASVASPPNRKKARELLQRGADLGNVLAQYNLGLAYKNGDLGVNAALADDNKAGSDPTSERTSAAIAYQYLSKAAETGFVPASIETALALKEGRGIAPDPRRAIELLEIGASRGSWEAMYQIAQIYDSGAYGSDPDDIEDDISHNASEALIWYARAAEAGDTRSQARLADMLTKGTGVPSPQPETAARYWRLAAAGGDELAQLQLANLVRDGGIPARPKMEGDPDGGAEEIYTLYRSAFVRGNPAAGLELAKLFRTGFPPEKGSVAIPKSPEVAVALLWEAITRARRFPDDSYEADPAYEQPFGAELIRLYDASEAKRDDGTSLITEGQIEQLRADYGDPDKFIYINANALSPKQIRCKGMLVTEPVWVGLWDAKSSASPVERQFDWYERYHRCKDKPPNSKLKDEDLGFSKKIRELVRQQYENAEKDREKDPLKAKSFSDRLIDIVVKDKDRKK